MSQFAPGVTLDEDEKTAVEVKVEKQPATAEGLFREAGVAVNPQQVPVSRPEPR